MFNFFFQALLFFAIIYGCHALWKYLHVPSMTKPLQQMESEDLKRLCDSIDEMKTQLIQPSTTTDPIVDPIHNTDDNDAVDAQSKMEKDLEEFMRSQIHCS